MPLYTEAPTPVAATTPADSTVKSSVTSQTASIILMNVRSNRKGATIYNDSTSKMYIDFQSTVSNTDYAVPIPAKGLYELPFPYTGLIYAIWDAANGAARVREFV